MNEGNWKYFWRAVAGISALSLTALAVMFWSAWRASPFKASAFGKPLESGIDVLAIQLDILSLIVALLGIALAVVGFFGYQAIKTGAEQKAAAKADEVATAAVAAYMQNIGGTDKGTQSSVEPTQVTEITNDEEGD
jgi:hypothetical protein